MSKQKRKPDDGAPVDEAYESALANPVMPDAIRRDYSTFQIADDGFWVVMSDLHIPYHVPEVVEIAITRAAKRRGASVLLNGDILDSHEVSDFDKDPSAPRYIAERAAALQFFAYLRKRLPKRRIIFKAGNHDERLGRYMMRRAPAVFGLPGTTLPDILRLRDFGIEYVGDKRPIRIGSLNVLHGHEHRGGITAPVNPARGLFLRSKANAACGHFHQTSSHREKNLNGKEIACWSIGCCCGLNPDYAPLNKWNHGFAEVELFKGKFHFRNVEVMNGEVV